MLFNKDAAKSGAEEPVTHVPCLTPPSQYYRIPRAPLTPDQRSMLDQLQARLPEIIAKTPAADHAKHQRFCSTGCLHRYLRANKWQLDKAQVGLEKTLQWRSEYRPDEITPESVESEAVRGKMYPNGYDLFGRPAIYMRQRLNHTHDKDMQMRYLVFTLERAVQMMPSPPSSFPSNAASAAANGTNRRDSGAQVRDAESSDDGPEALSLVIDCEGWSMSNSVPLGTARETLNILGSHYPERLGHAFVLNAPWLFWTFFKLVSPFVDPVTRRKINFVDLKTQHSIPVQHYNDGEVVQVVSPSSATTTLPSPVPGPNVPYASQLSSTEDLEAFNFSHLAARNGHQTNGTTSVATTPEAIEKAKKPNKSSEIWANLRNYFSDNYLEASVGGRFHFQYLHEQTWPYLCKLFEQSKPAASP
ncbi:hypothetical protein IWQ60_009344 [Tieghemiomyces parasiticus]|uniref:CRAL-TRIO domain-containing protein n=1 Tax=Tieghemiomyces parasiticus TaxID=78921 RepID=A0A9W8DLA8_9FUNG|nr:hypothetical protein IWQ60_009344 [Tieghemiomyces parasiticus]